MTEVVENTNTADEPQQLGLISTIFRCYRENFSLFWRIMMPVIIFSFLFNIGENFSESFVAPENLWRFGISDAVRNRTYRVFLVGGNSDSRLAGLNVKNFTHRVAVKI